MEQSLPTLTKKLWNMAKLGFYMLKKGMSKKRILLNLNLMMKQRNYPSHIEYDYGSTIQGPREYEFSCRNTPLYSQYFTNKGSKHQLYHFSMDSPNIEDIDMKSLDAIDTILETIVLSNKDGEIHHGELKVTDSPFPMRNKESDDQHVDVAAEEFIKRFYCQLIKEQTC